NVLKTASDLGVIDAARQLHRSVEEDLKGFETSSARQRDLRNQRFKTVKAWAKLGATERRHIQDHAREEEDQGGTGSVSAEDGGCTSCRIYHVPRSSGQRQFTHLRQFPKEDKKRIPVLLISNAGTGVGSRIGGHARRGGGKMRRECMLHCTVGITSEYRTSRTCIFCFQETRLARARRIIQGVVKVVRVNGVIECVNPKCLSLKCGDSIRPQDAHSAVVIAIVGASNLFSPTRTTLPLFQQQQRPLGIAVAPITTINTSQSLELTSSSSSSIRIPGESLADRGVL
ncbi:hypothetical protein BGW38_006245, partial [Lunasporangiospora selenospora]